MPIQRGSNKRERADIVIYGTQDSRKREQHKDIIGIVETKRNERKDGIKQLTSYMSATSCSWGVWTNGIEIEYLSKTQTGKILRDTIYQIPKEGETLESINKLTKGGLKPASNLKLIFKRILNTLYTNTNISRREKLGNEMIRIIFCKIYDEQYHINAIPKFRIEHDDNEFTAVSERINKLFESVKRDLVQEGVFDENERITLEPKSIAYVVGELQIYSLLGTDKDVVGDAFEVFAESKLVGEKGEFFTPREVVKTAVQIIDPQPDELICDPACGSGGFLIYALEHIWSIMGQDTKWKGMAKDEMNLAKKEMAKRTIYGIDKEIDLVKITKAYMSIIGDGKSNIAQQNSLHRADDFEGFAKHLFVEDNKFRKFDVILTNPPFGSKNTKVLESECKYFDLGHKWKQDGNKFIKTTEVKKTPPQELFIELCLNMLKDKGRLAIVLPETYFHAPSKKFIVDYIKQGNNIKYVIDLPHNTFRPHCNAKTILLILEKGVLQGNITFGVAEEIGYDHLGKIKMRADENGFITDKVWDDTEIIRKELKHGQKEYVFTISSEKIKNNIFVPRYYWQNKASHIKDKAKEKNLYLLPMHKLLDESIIEIYKGHGSPPGQYKGLGDIPYVRAGDIGNWAVYKNPISSVPQHIYNKVKGNNGVNLLENDIVFVKEGSYRIGDVALLLPTDTNILLNSHCFIIRVVKDNNNYKIDPYYLIYLLSHSLTKQQLYNKVFLDTTLPNIGDRWKELLLPVNNDNKELIKIKTKMKQIFKIRKKSENMIQSVYI